MRTTRRILCIAPSWLGDAVLSLPAVARLRQAGAQVEVLARRGVVRVYADWIEPQSLHPTAGESRWQRWRDASRLRPQRYDATLILAPSFSAALMARLAGSPVRLGQSGDGRSFLLTHALPRASRDVHLARTYEEWAARLLSLLSMPVPPPWEPERTLLQASESERRVAAEILRQCGSSARERFLVVAPGARYGPAKRYPPERFAAAAAVLADETRAAVLLVGSEADRRETAAVRQHLPDAMDLAGRTSLADLLGLLAAASGVLSNDSGVMHLAGALGTPVVAVFGSTHPGWTAPWGPRAHIVQHPVPCAPCFRKHCPIDFPCMRGIPPERLVESMRALLAAEGPRRPSTSAPL